MKHNDERPSGAISIRRCREVLGHEADDLSDEEIDQIRQHAHVMAQVILEIFLGRDAPRE